MQTRHPGAYDRRRGGDGVACPGARQVIALPRSGPLLERDAELAVIDGLVRDLPAGEARVLLLEGDAGIGKSRLLGELAGGRRKRRGRPGADGSGQRARAELLVRRRPAAARGGRARRGRGCLRRRRRRGAADPRPAVRRGPPGAEDGSFAALHGLYWLTDTGEARLALGFQAFCGKSTWWSSRSGCSRSAKRSSRRDRAAPPKRREAKGSL